jgi:SAM-dependent methyltransferase
MPTIPPEHALPTGDEPHRHRDIAESFGLDAERYDRVRPDYPAALIERILAASPGSSVLDVGCGTGIAARQFQAAGCTVLGVDVDTRMAELARQRGLDVEVAAFEAWDPAGRVFDAVVSGQTWHWVDPAAGAAKAANVLRPGGRLAVFWNAAQPPPELEESFAEIYRRLMPDSPAARRSTTSAAEGYSAMGAVAADGIRGTGAFGEPEEWRFDWQRTYTRDEWLDQVPTFGGHAMIPPARLAELLAGIGDAVDAAGGEFTMHYTTVVGTAVTAGAGG